MELRFDDRFTRELPADPSTELRRRQVLGAAWSSVAPTPVPAPKLLAWSTDVARILGLPQELVLSDDFAQVMAGNRTWPGMKPYAACYGGHQFGNWAGQLGDGRAITLGELVTPDGARQELQLKGAGPTPYSRSGDGRAVLRSSLREYACSEAMHWLGVPTTRALSLVTTGEDVIRDMLYDGNAAPEPGAIVCRVAPTFLRFGNFEIFTSRGDKDTLRLLVEHTIRHHFSHLGPPTPDTYAAWYREVCERTATMIVGWMRVGFVHGVMNTDNMSILGLTIDYGPYGWIDDFDPDWTPNTTDASHRRYRFGQQPQIAAWNLAQLARAILPVMPGTKEEGARALEAGLDAYVAAFEREQGAMLAAKIGLPKMREGDGPGSDATLVNDLLGLLASTPTDMTIFHRRLADVPVATPPVDSALLDIVRPAYYDDAIDGRITSQMVAWLRRWIDRVRENDETDGARRARMNATNPKYVLRNYLAQLAIDDAAKGDTSTLDALLDTLVRPYDEQPDRERFAGKRPEWARNRVGCSMLSCSS